ncbi:MAG: NAD(P)-dependent oxidoreductase [Burkholderiales bacterium]|nr:NAD(P)-dependent oxidoreductase [Burkholderiales bacterium]
MESIGFVGAGMMGHGICANLLAAGHPLTVTAHRARSRIEDLVGRGAREAATLEALAERAEVLMLCVNRADTVREIVGGPGAKLRTGALVIDTTTSLPEVSRGLAAALAPRGIDFVDAPLIGGPAQAAEGRLGSLVGATPGALARARPILERYNAQIAHFGPPGAGNVAKLLNNFLTVGTRALIAQVFAAARRQGIEWGDFYRVIAIGAAGSRTLDTMVRTAIDGDYRGNQFSIDNCTKDMRYAEAVIGDDADGLRMQQAMLGFFQRFVDSGHGERFASEMLDPALSDARGRER